MRTPKKSATRPIPRQIKRPGHEEIWRRVTRELADDLAVDALARDRSGKAPYDEVARLQEAGLPALLTPPGPAPRGADWRAACRVLREISAADSSIGELLAHHYVLSWSGRFFGTAAASTDALDAPPAADVPGTTSTLDDPGAGGRLDAPGTLEVRAARERWLLAGGVEPAWGSGGQGLTLHPSGSGWVLDGRRAFDSGVTVADRLVVGAPCSATGDVLVVLVDPADPGVFVESGGDRVGQRLAGAGTVSFDRVPVESGHLLGRLPRDEHAVAPFTTLAPLALRLALVHVALGIAEGALAEARDISRATRAAPLSADPAAVAAAAEYAAGTDQDPYLLLMYGELATAAHAAAAVVDRATEALAHGLLAERSLGVEERGDIAVLVAAAEAVTARAAILITTRILELVDAARTADEPGGGPGLDRFWRNARVLTAHASAAHRLRDIGDHYLHGPRPQLTTLP
ncbi:acyl-CoA dehydrogenase family protein [Streptomyces sp. NPDC053755]|uniref:acyl-CoA dehydrogenase family protein n=1 Tax=Streptomyces sp. NPDC053755 TaxID=3155815 RepID=UPI003428D325